MSVRRLAAACAAALALLAAATATSAAPVPVSSVELPFAVAVDARGRVFVADAGTRRILRLDVARRSSTTSA
jgi:streptogramin lyase